MIGGGIFLGVLGVLYGLALFLLPLWATQNKPSNDLVLSCGVSSCHGLDYTCSYNQAEICTEIYQVEDKCLQYAQCGVGYKGKDSKGKRIFECEKVENDNFTKCKSCVQNCLDKYKTDNVKIMECESVC